MSLSIPIPVKSNGDGEPVDWKLLKKEVISRLNIIDEYEKLEVKFVNKYRGGKDRCWVRCYAVGRAPGKEDDVDSAAVNADTGYYIDKGGDGAGKDFFNFALEHGRFATWIECFRHYADKVGIEIGNIKRSGPGIEEEVYEYRDADGTLRYGVFKFRLATGKKDFRQYPWVDGAWLKEKHCMDGVPPLPYRLHELLASREDEPCLWLEGEKDVDRAYEAGFVATTSHMGAGNFRHTGRLFLDAGLVPARDYVVIPDNDPKGRDHALEVAEALHGYLGAINPCWIVKLLPLPGVPFKGDLSDWFDLGGTAEELRAMIDAAPAWEPGAKVEEPPIPEGEDAKGLICTLEDVARVVSDDNWVWEKWISTEALTLVAAEPGIGKTLFMMDLHRRAYHGLPWPDGMPMNLIPGGMTLWIPADRHYKQMLKVADDFGIPRSAIAVNAEKKDEPMSGNTLMTADDLLNLERNIRLVRPYWVVIDTITQTGDYKSQDTVDAKRQYTPLQEMALRTGVPIICVTHLNAGKGVIGRRAVEKCRTVIKLSRPDLEGQPHRRRLWVDKSWDLTPPDLGVTVGTEGYEYDDSPPEEAEKSEAPARAAKPLRVDECRKWLEDTLGAGTQAVHELIDLAEETGFSKPTLYRAKEKLDVNEFELHGRKHWQLNFPD